MFLVNIKTVTHKKICPLALTQMYSNCNETNLGSEVMSILPSADINFDGV